MATGHTGLREMEVAHRVKARVRHDKEVGLKALVTEKKRARRKGPDLEARTGFLKQGGGRFQARAGRGYDERPPRGAGKTRSAESMASEASHAVASTACRNPGGHEASVELQQQLMNAFLRHAGLSGEDTGRSRPLDDLEALDVQLAHPGVQEV